MIERDAFDGDVFEIACDSCPEDIELDTGGDWGDLIKQLKDDGWKIRKEGEEWKHYCPGCATKKDGRL